MLEELESHAWKSGEIVDTGKHNDLVMALAHAVDQFSSGINDVPVVMGTMNRGEWQGGKNRKRGSNVRRSGMGGKVVSRRRL